MKIQSAIILGSLVWCLGSCASSTAVVEDSSAIRMIEQSLSPDQPRALPRTLAGCEHRGMVHVRVPEGTMDPGFLEPPPGLVDQLKAFAARKGANTVVVLPGKRVIGDSFRGSAFLCPAREP